MTDKKDPDDPAARKARADAIRRARDKRKADLTAPNDQTADPSSERDPNYVDFIDRKMRKK
ncbi:MAG TPA: hypothetical protein VH497_02060 [Vicinamibacterales bacterium]|jgi:hypothetical protein